MAMAINVQTPAIHSGTASLLSPLMKKWLLKNKMTNGPHTMRTKKKRTAKMHVMIFLMPRKKPLFVSVCSFIRA